MVSRAEEYERRMKALGYGNSLDVMDDEDIEEALARMDGGRTEELEQPLYRKFRPVDPGLAARVFRQMGRPYDRQAVGDDDVYINSWDDGDDEVTQAKPGPAMVFAPSRGAGRRPDEVYNPWANVWKPDWGADGIPAQAPRTMDNRLTSWGQRGLDKYGYGVQSASGTTPDFASYSEGRKVTRAAPIIREIVKEGTEGTKELIKLDKFGEKAYKAAREQDYTHDEAMEIAREAQFMYGSYRAANLASTGLLALGTKHFKWTIPTYVGKELGDEAYEDEIHKYIIGATINNRKTRRNPPEGAILPP